MNLHENAVINISSVLDCLGNTFSSLTWILAGPSFTLTAAYISCKKRDSSITECDIIKKDHSDLGPKLGPLAILS